MRIVVNDLAASSTGALTVLRSFYEYVKENEPDDEWIFLLSDKLIEESEHIQLAVIPWVKKSWLHKLWCDFVCGRRIINRLNPDYVLSLQNVITYGVKAPQGVYIHQSIPFQTTKRFSFFKRDETLYAIYQYLIGWVIKKSARLADDVFVQTQWMKKAVAQQSRINQEKITVVPVVAKAFTRGGIQPEQNRFFYPAGFEAIYKNHECLYQACDVLDAQGITQYRVDVTLEKPNRPVSKHIRFVGHLSTEQMLEEYCKSTLVFPSYIETVGLPLIEAIQIGARILAADCEYAREALEGYSNASFFNPFYHEELAQLMQKTMQSGQCVVLQEDNVREQHESIQPWSNLMSRIKGKSEAAIARRIQ